MRITRNVITISDLYHQMENRELIVNKVYQRNSSLWPSNAMSFFIDTILNEFTFPKITIRQTININTKKAKREIVDGQQRLTTIQKFINDEYSLSAVSGKYKGLKFADLPENEKTKFLGYEVSVDTVTSGTDQEVLEIFRRMNSYSLPLNPQELRHATYQGDFKWFIFNLVEKYSSFLINTKIITVKEAARMKDGDLLTEITQLNIDGIVSRQKVKLDNLYKNFDEQMTDDLKNGVDDVLELINNQFSDIVSEDAFKQYHFYSLCSALMYNKSEIKISETLRSKEELIPQYEYYGDLHIAKQNLRVLIDSLQNSEDENYSNRKFKSFIEASTSTTHSIANREIRFEWFLKAIQNEEL